MRGKRGLGEGTLRDDFFLNAFSIRIIRLHKINQKMHFKKALLVCFLSCINLTSSLITFTYYFPKIGGFFSEE